MANRHEWQVSDKLKVDMRNKQEYILCKQVATYLRLQYPKVIYHFDLAGLNLSKAQSGMMKSIQGGRGFPDLFIAEPKVMEDHICHGLFLEIKKKGTKIRTRHGELVSDPHIREQYTMLQKLEAKGYMALFACGFMDSKKFIDTYLG